MDKIIKVIKQTSWQLVGKLISSFATTFVVLLVANHYQEYGTGLFTLTITYLGFFYLAVDFGVNAHIIRDLMGEEKELVWRKLLGFRLLLSLLFVVLATVLLLFMPFNSVDFSLSIIIGSLSIIASGVFITSSALFQANLKYHFLAISIAFSTIVGALLMAYLIYIKVLLPYLIIAQVIGWFVCAFVSILFVKKIINKLSPIFDIIFIKKNIKETWPIALTLILNTIYFRIDAFMLGSIKSLAEVGIYNMAYLIFQATLVIPTFIMNSYYPLMISALRKSKENFLKEFKIVSYIFLGLGLLGIVLTLIFAPLIIRLLQFLIANNGFSGSINSLQLLSLGYPAYFLTSLLMWVLVLIKKYKTLTLIYLIGLVVNIFLNLYLIPKYSFIGASLTTSISEYLILLIQIFIMMTFFKSKDKNLVIK